MTTNVDAPVPGAPEPVETQAGKQFLDYVAQREGRADVTQQGDQPSEAPVPPAAEKEAAGSEPASEEHEEDESAEAAAVPGKRKGGFQRRIEKKDAEIRRLEGLLAERQSPPAAQQPPEAAPPAAAVDPAKPKLEDFDSIETFSEALTDWKLDQRAKIERQAAEEQRVQAANQALVGEWNERKTAFVATTPDYDEVIASVDDIKISDDLQRLFLRDENGPALAYTLASNPDELKRLAALPLLDAAKELGRLSTRLDPAPDEKKERTRAPKPPLTVRGGSAKPAPKLGDPQTDFLSFVKLRSAA